MDDAFGRSMAGTPSADEEVIDENDPLYLI